MREIRNLEGTIMVRNEPLVSFTINRGRVEFVEVHRTEEIPWEFTMCEPKRALLEFLDDRVITENRIGLKEELEKIGIPYFDMDLILHYNYGYSFEDSYWIRFTGDKIQDYKSMLYKVLGHYEANRYMLERKLSEIGERYEGL